MVSRGEISPGSFFISKKTKKDNEIKTITQIKLNRAAVIIGWTKLSRTLINIIG